MPSVKPVTDSTRIKLTKRQIIQSRANLAKKAGALLQRLYQNALGELKTPDGDPLEMSNGQIRSAQIVLAKIIPDMQDIRFTEEKSEDVVSKEDLIRKLQGMLLANKELRELIPALVGRDGMEAIDKALAIDGEVVERKQDIGLMIKEFEP